jgi:pseudaminic acid biosynthesis-associated methylase
MSEPADPAEARRLEQIWSGAFGDEWSDRNIDAYDARKPFWDAMMQRLSPRRVLDVGCNVGGNLRWIAPFVGAGDAYGVDINRHSLELIHEFVPDANVLVASARDLPFRDGWFDLVFTVGVLIHHPEDALRQAMSEMARCSSRYVLCVEMFADEVTEVTHRGIEHGLFKRDYGRIFIDAVPELTVIDSGFLSVDEGFDSLNWWLFEKDGKVERMTP